MDAKVHVKSQYCPRYGNVADWAIIIIGLLTGVHYEIKPQPMLGIWRAKIASSGGSFCGQARTDQVPAKRARANTPHCMCTRVWLAHPIDYIVTPASWFTKTSLVRFYEHADSWTQDYHPFGVGKMRRDDRRRAVEAHGRLACSLCSWGDNRHGYDGFLGSIGTGCSATKVSNINDRYPLACSLCSKVHGELMIHTVGEAVREGVPRLGGRGVEDTKLCKIALNMKRFVTSQVVLANKIDTTAIADCNTR